MSATTVFLGKFCKVVIWLKSFGSEVSLSSASDNGLSLSQALGKNYVFLSLEPLGKLDFEGLEKFPLASFKITLQAKARVFSGHLVHAHA